MKTIANQHQLTSRSEEELFAKGIQLLDRKKYAAAQKNFDIVLLLNPSHIDAMLHRGVCKMHVGLVNLALDDFSEILMLANGRPEAYAAMAQAYWMLADFQMAKHFIDEALKSHESLKPEWYEMGYNIYSKLGLYSIAYSHINRAIVCNPFNPVLYYKRARVFTLLNKTQIAINDLNKAISFDPTFVNAYKLRSECKKRLGDDQGAQRDLILAKKNLPH